MASRRSAFEVVINENLARTQVRRRTAVTVIHAVNTQEAATELLRLIEENQ
jgi:hypothetical protein